MNPKNFNRLFRGEVQRQWTLLDSESAPSNTERADLIDMFSARYGCSPECAAKEIDRVAAELSEKLKRAA